jgi:putative endonuclease
MPYYVYVILCDDGSFYTGYTKNVGSRMRLHVNGKGARYTRMHKPKRLVYTEEFNSRTEAMRRERKVKAMKHDSKLRLMRSQTRMMRNRGRRRGNC